MRPDAVCWAVAQDDDDDGVSVAPLPDGAVGYQRRGLVGQGAMGEVHLAHDPVLRRNVAVKRLDPELVGVPALVRRFVTEAQITAQLDHPGIVAVHRLEVGEDGAPSYAMRLVRGRTLAQVIDDIAERRREGLPLDVGQTLPARLELFLDVCDAVAHAHRRRVIHRDLKPDNIMVGPYREVQVMDWGLARIIGTPEPALAGGPRPQGLGRTLHGMVVGTPRYMSPEQAEGRNDELDGRSDQYALGVILGELASLRPAEVRDGVLPTLTLTWTASDGPAAAAAARPRVEEGPGEVVPSDLRAIIDKATALRPDDRYETVDALADDVRRYLRDEEIRARPDNRGKRLLRWIGRNRQRVVTIGLALALTVVLVGVLGLIGAVTARELVAKQAAVREERLGAVTAAVTEQADRMDNWLLQTQGLLTGLAFTAEEVLQREVEPRPIYLSAQFSEGEGPPDLAESTVYDGPVSVGWPDIVLAPDATPTTGRLHQLAALHPALLRVQLRSHGEDALSLPEEAVRALIAEQGVPIVWAYVATEDGALVGAPGSGGYPDAYDPRSRPWYRVARDRRGPQWGAADADESGMGLLVTASTALIDRDDRVLGVAAVDVPFGHLIETLLEPPALVGRAEAFLVDGQGRTMVRSSQKERARDVTDYAPEPFAYDDVLREDGRRTGVETLDGGRTLMVWRRLDAIDWSYVVVGDPAVLLE